jgi:purine-binding chemotaxis protein CheW
LGSSRSQARDFGFQGNGEVGEDGNLQLVVFRVDGRRLALLLACVERIVRAVAVTPLPGAPSIALGVIDVAGRIIPVLGTRRRLNLPDLPIAPSDQFVIARAASRTLALVVDAVEGVADAPAGALVTASALVPGAEHLRGVVQLQDGLVVIQDLDRFLSLDEARALDKAMDKGRGSGG